uniref:Uncharacterized protein n=1 Tax=Panagrolaimus davidi TaxID=227884 RepID=A0A914NYW3_9BILA
MFKRQADCSPNGEILFEYPDILIIRKAMDRMTEDVNMAEIRSYYSRTNVYAPFTGMHLMQTTNLPALSHHIVDKKIKTDVPHLTHQPKAFGSSNCTGVLKIEKKCFKL